MKPQTSAHLLTSLTLFLNACTLKSNIEAPPTNTPTNQEIFSIGEIQVTPKIATSSSVEPLINKRVVPAETGESQEVYSFYAGQMLKVKGSFLEQVEEIKIAGQSLKKWQPSTENILNDCPAAPTIATDAKQGIISYAQFFAKLSDNSLCFILPTGITKRFLVTTGIIEFKSSIASRSVKVLIEPAIQAIAGVRNVSFSSATASAAAQTINNSLNGGGIAAPTFMAMQIDSKNQYHLFISDIGEHRIVEVVFTYQNNVYKWLSQKTILGTKTAGTSTFFEGQEKNATEVALNKPAGLSIYDHTLYVSDSGNHQVLALDLNRHVVTRVAGNGIAGESMSDADARNAFLNSPQGLAISSTGRELYIADSNNDSIKVVVLNRGSLYSLEALSEQNPNRSIKSIFKPFDLKFKTTDGKNKFLVVSSPISGRIFQLANIDSNEGYNCTQTNDEDFNRNRNCIMPLKTSNKNLNPSHLNILGKTILFANSSTNYLLAFEPIEGVVVNENILAQKTTEAGTSCTPHEACNLSLKEITYARFLNGENKYQLISQPQELTQQLGPNDISMELPGSILSLADNALIIADTNAHRILLLGNKDQKTSFQVAIPHDPLNRTSVGDWGNNGLLSTAIINPLKVVTTSDSLLILEKGRIRTVPLSANMELAVIKHLLGDGIISNSRESRFAPVLNRLGEVTEIAWCKDQLFLYEKNFGNITRVRSKEGLWIFEALTDSKEGNQNFSDVSSLQCLNDRLVFAQKNNSKSIISMANLETLSDNNVSVPFYNWENPIFSTNSFYSVTFADGQPVVATQIFNQTSGFQSLLYHWLTLVFDSTVQKIEKWDLKQENMAEMKISLLASLSQKPKDFIFSFDQQNQKIFLMENNQIPVRGFLIAGGKVSLDSNQPMHATQFKLNKITSIAPNKEGSRLFFAENSDSGLGRILMLIP